MGKDALMHHEGLKGQRARGLKAYHHKVKMYQVVGHDGDVMDLEVN